MKYIIIAGIGILVAFLVALYFIPLGIEPLTELYFENHTELPKHVFLDKDYDFSFTIHNLEYQDVEYAYSVDVYDVNGTLLFTIENSTIFLSQNETGNVYEQVNFNEGFEKARINVKITKNPIGEPDFKRKLWWEDPNYPNEINIHFWVEEIVPTTIKIVEG